MKKYNIESIYKKIIVTSSLMLVSVSSFASMGECISSVKNKDWKGAIEYCQPLSEDSREALGFTSNAYAQLEKGMNAQKYGDSYIYKYKSSDPDKVALAAAYTGTGNLYYFKDNYGATRDIKKGLEYITKGAELGNVIAQEQLGSIYTGGDNDSIPTNILTSYYWYQTAGINGNQKAKKSPMLQKIDAFKKQLPYCIAQGEQLVAQSYIDGKAGLSQDKYQAKKYLTQAIALYKKEDKPSADELKYCPPQKGLDLKSAEKLLAGLKWWFNVGVAPMCRPDYAEVNNDSNSALLSKKL